MYPLLQGSELAIAGLDDEKLLFALLYLALPAINGSNRPDSIDASREAFLDESPR